MDKKKILITGGSGTVGKHLSEMLLKKGYEVAHLSRSEGNHPKIKTYLWDVDQQQIDENCIDGVDTIVHLAGAGIADSRWTDKRKDIIITSRTDSIALIYDLLKRKTNQVKNVVSASAAGFYSDRKNTLLSETDSPNTDFLAHSCVLWEKAVDKGAALGLRVVKFRTGVILDLETGALPEIAKPIKWGVGSPLGSGKQWISWIHLDDVVNMYLKGIEDQRLKGAYNMSTPYPLTNEALTKAIANQLDKKLWAPKVPAFALKLMLGEMSAVVLGSTKMSVQKIEETGFKFKFPEVKAALKDIYG
ncbi:MAG: TIGR01777 family oxidoreductase [Pelobium sp.]